MRKARCVKLLRAHGGDDDAELRNASDASPGIALLSRFRQLPDPCYDGDIRWAKEMSERLAAGTAP